MLSKPTAISWSESNSASLHQTQGASFFQDEQTAGPFAYFRHRHVFELYDGHTRMTDVVSLSAPVFGFLVDRVLLVPYMKRLLTRRGQALARMSDEPDGTSA
jgi:ligand-binding SRPBCC domain-containing protein